MNGSAEIDVLNAYCRSVITNRPIGSDVGGGGPGGGGAGGMPTLLPLPPIGGNGGAGGIADGGAEITEEF